MNKFNPLIFREYDIRGVAERDLASDVVAAIGRAYGTYLRRKGKASVTLGRDSRVSSPRIHRALLDGILSTGLHVVDIGLSTTPCLYFSIHHLNKDGGAMVTGSHNPPDQNGIKMCIGTSSLFGAEIQELKRLIESNDFDTGKGQVSEKTVLADYADYIEKLFKFKRKFRVGVDCGNGMTALLAPKLFERMGHEVFGLYTEVDGTFPNHPADPSDPENLEDLIHAVRKNHLDCGLAFDGDGDRVGVVDEKGGVIYGDQLLILFARSVLQTNPGAKIIGDVKCSSTLFQDIEKHGGKPIMWKTGHSLIKAKMKEEGALLAGEVSGHMFFKHRWFGFDSGIYAACRLLEILDQSGKPLSRLLADLPKTFATPELRVPSSDERKFQVVKEVTNYFKQKHKVIDVDGARIQFSDGSWALVRASNTQPVLVLRFEAMTEPRLNEIRSLVEGKLKELMK